MLRRTRGVAIAVVAGGLTLSACGGDDDGGSETTSPAVTSDAPTTEAPNDDTTAPAAPTAEPAAGTTEPAPDGTATAATTGTAATAESTGPAGAASPDACALLGEVDLAGLLGEPAGEPESTTDDFGSGCLVPALDPESRGGVSLRVDTQSAESNYDNQAELFGVDAEIADLGDSAFHKGAMVVVRDGERLLNLKVVRWAELGIGGAAPADVEAAMRIVLAAG